MEKTPKANKELGQHFLKDKSVVDKIMADAPEKFDAIVEIGPGPGVLTARLNEFNHPLYLVEMDERFEPHLRFDNVFQIFFQDAMAFDWESFLRQKELKGKTIWLVSNLPYNVSSQLFVQFLRVEEIKKMTLMYQKEVGEKTYIRRNVKNQNNSLLGLSQAYMESRMIVKVPPGAFLPPPKVDSVVVGYKRKATPEVPLNEFRKFEGFLRKLFVHKRKQIGSVLKTWPEGKPLLKKLQIEGFDLKKGAESLSLEEVFGLYKRFKQLV